MINFILRDRACRSLTILSLVLGTVSLTAFLPAAAQQQQQERRLLDVTGTARVSIPTNLAQVSLGVEAQGANAAEVQQELANKSSAVVSLLRSRNADRIETTGVKLEPLYSSEEPHRIIGYIGRNIVSFRINTEASGKLMDDAIQAGANKIDSVAFLASIEDINKAKQQAIRLAAIDAQTKANAALNTLNFSRRDIIRIHISDEAIPTIGEGAAANISDTNTIIVGGNKEVKSFVTLEITY